ncbi:homocysteine S-methyltransferase [Reticulomyxa filosa]|uniref:Homocysteine S-methyltransferase n=1 Tax=Reticulomyxa filosa TaxID=46433 RepID=X6LYU1_RETFI|nr:homocysteine S-methyltransferase [Reticulomyxa filosa]|eukprot:ETO07103.1 homocysteine S-methyltransferase [Reticulomyxa filosa]
MSDPLSKLLEQKKKNFLLLDGGKTCFCSFCAIVWQGLATHLEEKGFDISGSLWASKLLLTNPDAIVQAHLDYLRVVHIKPIVEALQKFFFFLPQKRIKYFQSKKKTLQLCVGCNIKFGLSEKEGYAKISESVELAQKAIDHFGKEGNKHSKEVIIAGSVGCYGATLHDGSEYTGIYDITEESKFDFLKAFHKPRMQALLRAKRGNDIVIACETVPLQIEILAMCACLDELQCYGWISMCCRNDSELCSGEKLCDVVPYLLKSQYCIGIGINCLDPVYVTALLDTIQSQIRGQPKRMLLIAYPNKGEKWDDQTRQWIPGTKMSDAEFTLLAKEWVQHGAQIIGGCCRTNPQTIATISKLVRHHFPLAKL